MRRTRSPAPEPGRSESSKRISAGLLLVSATACLLAVQLGCGRSAAQGERPRMIVLGFDGMDYDLTRQMMAQGQLPNFTRLAEQGTFSALGTTVPPQSPVAWSSFITGLDPGGHGIFDFIHRDPATMIPYLSTSRTHEPERTIEIGKWQLPLVGGGVELLRRGQPFWEVLEDHGVETTIIRIPANFPPSGSASCELSGMGTPDILGTYGTFSFYTSELFASDREVSGGEIFEAWPEEGVVQATLYGPENPLLVEPKKLEREFFLYLDPVEPVAKLVVGDEERILKLGEWSDWVSVEFELMPIRKLRGICRFYLRQLEPELELYVTPINMDPLDPAMPISTPRSFAAELAEATGAFYTQGMPEDTHSLDQGVLSRGEFLAQTRIAGEEVINQFRYVLDRFEDGLLFYYFGNPDQISHMMWRQMDPEHPAYDPVADPPFADAIKSVYRRMDDVVGYTLENMGEGTTLVVMSDHGFTSWRRVFHLNSWLRDNGYLAAKNPRLEDDPGFFSNVDWSRTRAYGLGINGLYINLRGREKDGIVDAGDRQALMREIAAELLATLDPETGKPAITKVYLREEVYKDRGQIEIAPDLIVGYAKGTRCSNESALGTLTVEVFADNTGEWTGDHLMDHETVPGILVTNRPLKKEAPSLQDLGAAILAEFGIEGFPFRG